MKINGSDRVINPRQRLFYYGKYGEWYLVECTSNEANEPCVIVLEVATNTSAIHQGTLQKLMKEHPTFVEYNWGNNRMCVKKEEIERIYHGVEV